jgi:hypothetical protein
LFVGLFVCLFVCLFVWLVGWLFGWLVAGQYVKPEAAITVFELLIMGGVSLETC